MFQSLSVDGFRGFPQITVEHLNRCNLFIGRNSVGKTALLESLFLLLGPTNPELTLTISSFRGIEQFRANPEDIWGWLFYKKDVSEPIMIQVQTANGGTRRLTLSVSESAVLTRVPHLENGPQRSTHEHLPSTGSTPVGPSELNLKYTDERGQLASTRISIKEDRILAIDRNSSIRFPNSVFISARGGHQPENAERYSQLEEVNNETSVLEALSRLEPRLRRLAILVTTSGPVIHGDIGLGRMVPLPLMGDGVSRLLTILLGILTSQNGAVLVDEIENGIHYSVLQTVWDVLAQAARENNVQLFATTHSWECLKAAHESFSESSEYDFCVHRLDRDGESINSTCYDQSMIDTAIHAGIEVR